MHTYYNMEIIRWFSDQQWFLCNLGPLVALSVSLSNLKSRTTIFANPSITYLSSLFQVCWSTPVICGATSQPGHKFWSKPHPCLLQDKG